MDKDQFKGRAKEVAGNIKEGMGKMTGDKSLEQRGKFDKSSGHAQANYGDKKNEIKKDMQQHSQHSQHSPKNH